MASCRGFSEVCAHRSGHVRSSRRRKTCHAISSAAASSVV
jgi:hypothetical protein